MDKNELKDIDYNTNKKINEAKELENVLKQLNILELYDLWYQIEILEVENQINKKIFNKVFYMKRKKDLLFI